MTMNTKKPHLIYIVADQLRYDVLGRGCTPNLDALAAQSVQFSRAYCACPLCVPARGALFTGTCPNTNGSLINPWLMQDKPYGYVREGIDHLYGMMERGGWDCFHTGKQHLFLKNGILEQQPGTKTHWLSTEHTYKDFLQAEGARPPGGASFRSPVPEMGSGRHTRVCTYSNANTGCYEPGLAHYFDGYFTDRAIEGLRERDKEKPLFLSAMFLAPHPPLDVPQPYFSALKPEDITLPENVGVWYPRQSPLQMYNLTGIVGARYSEVQWREAWRAYLGLVSLLDDCVGRIIDELKAQNIYDDCLIVFTADHGEMLGSHRLFQKMCMYEESVRVPLFFRLPQAQGAGTLHHEPVSHIDVQPTLCELLHTPPQSPMDGVSLADTLHAPEKAQQGARSVFIQFDGNGSLSNFQRCVVSGEHKLIVDIFKDEIYFELYNLCQDRQETHNLLFAQQADDAVRALDTAQTLLDTLTAHMRATGDRITLPEIDLASFVSCYRELPGRV